MIAFLATRRENRLTARRLAWWVGLFGYLGLLYWLSSQPVETELFPQADKLVHIGIYTGLVLVGYRALRETLPNRKGVLLFAVLIALIYGALDEWHQSTVPTREASVFDWIADLIGALIAVALVRRHRQRIAKGEGG